MGWLQIALQNLGVVYRLQHDFKQAKDYAIKALEVYRQLDLAYHEAEILHDFGLIAIGEEAYTQAIKHFNEALPIFEKLGSLIFQAECHYDLGRSWGTLQQMDRQRQHWEKAIQLYQALKMEDNVKWIQKQLQSQNA